MKKTNESESWREEFFPEPYICPRCQTPCFGVRHVTLDECMQSIGKTIQALIKAVDNLSIKIGRLTK